MHIYPYKTEERLREAKNTLNRMNITKNPDELKRALFSFLNASRFCMGPLLKDYKNKLDRFNDWWNNKADFLERNKLCSFFRNLRNEVIKEGKDVLKINWAISDSSTMNGPLQIDPDGTVFKGQDGRWTPIEDVQGRKILSWDFHKRPQGYNSISAYSLCKNYLDILDGIMNEFIAKFGQLK